MQFNFLFINPELLRGVIMICPICGFKNTTGANFCEKCNKTFENEAFEKRSFSMPSNISCSGPRKLSKTEGFWSSRDSRNLQFRSAKQSFASFVSEPRNFVLYGTQTLIVWYVTIKYCDSLQIQSILDNVKILKTSGFWSPQTRRIRGIGNL